MLDYLQEQRQQTIQKGLEAGEELKRQKAENKLLK